MSDVLKAAFLFVAPHADPKTHQQWVKTPKVEILAIGVSNYQQAVETAKQLVKEALPPLSCAAVLVTRAPRWLPKQSKVKSRSVSSASIFTRDWEMSAGIKSFDGTAQNGSFQ